MHLLLVCWLFLQIYYLAAKSFVLCYCSWGNMAKWEWNNTLLWPTMSFHFMLYCSCLSLHLEDTLTSSAWHWCSQEFAMNAIQTWRGVDVAQDAVIPNRGRTPTRQKITRSSYREEGPLLSHGCDWHGAENPPTTTFCPEGRLNIIRQNHCTP